MRRWTLGVVSFVLWLIFYYTLNIALAEGNFSDRFYSLGVAFALALIALIITITLAIDLSSGTSPQ